MDSARPTLARRRQSTPSSPIRQRVAWFLGLSVSFLLIWQISSFQARALVCTTTENTYCPRAWEETLSPLTQVSYWAVPRKIQSTEETLIERFPEIAGVSIRRTFDGRVFVEVSQAPVLFPLSIDGTLYEVRESGLLSRRDGEWALVPLLANGAQRQENRLNSEIWSKVSLENTSLLLKNLEHFTPRIKKILLDEPKKVVLYPEGYGMIFVRVDESGAIATQLGTLQAFFRSSTMKDTYQELDVRFANLVVKE